jgi:methylated-DNA-[protein]-cysteine S-methyltransferase
MTMTTRWTTTDTPNGPFTVLADDDGTVLASGWTADLGELLPLAPGARTPQHAADLGPITKSVLAYYDGDLAAVDAVPVRQRSGAFLDAAREQLRTVRPGAAVTYTELAARAGRPTAVRAAAAACARNAAALFVPCHRIIRLDGGLGGFRWGLPVKRWLLQHESTSR